MILYGAGFFLAGLLLFSHNDMSSFFLFRYGYSPFALERQHMWSLTRVSLLELCCFVALAASAHSYYLDRVNQYPPYLCALVHSLPAFCGAQRLVTFLSSLAITRAYLSRAPRQRTVCIRVAEPLKLVHATRSHGANANRASGASVRCPPHDGLASQPATR